MPRPTFPAAAAGAHQAARRVHLSGSWPARSPLVVAAIVALVYGLWLAAVLAEGHDARDFIVIGKQFVERSHRSAVIGVDPTYTYSTHAGHYVGYDGQFCYYIALDPLNAWAYLDDPSYRYTRIVYPLAARLLARGQPAALPAALIAVNLLALVGGTAAVAAWLVRQDFSPWPALCYGFYPGLFASLQRDLTEPLAYCFVALAVYRLSRPGRWRILGAGGAFALAGLTREVCAVFALAYGLALLWGDGQEGSPPCWSTAARLLATALLPLALYKWFLALHFGGMGKLSTFSGTVPFGGIVTLWPWATAQVIALLGVIVPSLLFAAPVVRLLARGRRPAACWAYLAQTLLFVVLLADTSYREYNAVGRITAGIVLAAVYCVPALAHTLPARVWQPWSRAAVVLWLAPFVLLLPIPWQGIPHLA
ncbi:MAG: hypothetical protein NVSMB65_09420 [Chloroflexota bacterium]